MNKNLLERGIDGAKDTLIKLRKSGEPFFGVQTVFAPYIDKLIAEQDKSKKDPATPTEGTTTPRPLF